MGKFKIDGVAEKICKTDLITMTILFKKSNAFESDAIKLLMIECESFLSQLKNAGFNMENVSVEAESSNVCEKNGSKYYEVKKKIQLCFKANLKLSNSLVKLLLLDGYEAEYILSFSFINESELRKDLLIEAVKNSKQKAEIIANAMNMKIVGIEEINKSAYSYNLVKSVCVDDFDEKIDDLFIMDSVDTSISDTLNTPEEKLKETVEVVWLTEYWGVKMICEMNIDMYESLKECLSELNSEIEVSLLSSDPMLQKLGFSEKIPCTVDVRATKEQIDKLSDMIIDFEISAYNTPDGSEPKESDEDYQKFCKYGWLCEFFYDT